MCSSQSMMGVQTTRVSRKDAAAEVLSSFQRSAYTVAMAMGGSRPPSLDKQLLSVYRNATCYLFFGAGSWQLSDKKFCCLGDLSSVSWRCQTFILKSTPTKSSHQSAKWKFHTWSYVIISKQIFKTTPKQTEGCDFKAVSSWRHT